ncbi:MipA/OmpV family protein [Sphingomonas oligophenolica]|uniref:MipA/OmpV family protein n=1 Tax=Sphingomonas oligophenolica TaxID=301154 RepID=A0A502CGZ4_9SPHN|nr:MipA/OmpV family protein [Sphingomonas oligophenolica]TPG12995.1 MipA/OmpV family protein [Sphingomonas oligophenolica]
MIQHRFALTTTSVLVALLATVASVVPAAAQAADQDHDAPYRTRVGLGPQIVPSFPGADTVRVQPFFDFVRARGDEPFAFEAPDESIGFAVLTLDRLSVGPVLGFEGRRRSSDVGGRLPAVGSTVEIGGFVQYQLAPAARLRTEVRQGIGGHRGLIADISADYVARRGDAWLFSLGPRVTITNERYERAYFGVSPSAAAASGLRAFAAGGGIESIGATAGFVRQFTPRWGIYSYAKYERLVGDPARSPIVARYGSKNQASAGLALTYTFGRGVGR